MIEAKDIGHKHRSYEGDIKVSRLREELRALRDECYVSESGLAISWRKIALRFGILLLLNKKQEE